MNFVNKEHFNIFLRGLTYLGQGFQGICYLNKNNNIVYKVFHEYMYNEKAGYDKDFLLRFSNIKNNTFIWPTDVIYVENELVGYTMPYKNSKNLFQIDPLSISLNALEKGLTNIFKDIKIITDNNVTLYDVMYNIMYKNGRLYVVDTLEYGINKTSYENNRACIDNEIMLFLVDDYFDYFVKDNLLLNEMYMDYNVSSLEFLKEFRKKLSEYLDKDITKLNDAKSLVKKSKATYQRSI